MLIIAYCIGYSTYCTLYALNCIQYNPCSLQYVRIIIGIILVFAYNFIAYLFFQSLKPKQCISHKNSLQKIFTNLATSSDLSSLVLSTATGNFLTIGFKSLSLTWHYQVAYMIRRPLYWKAIITIYPPNIFLPSDFEWQHMTCIKTNGADSSVPIDGVNFR